MLPAGPIKTKLGIGTHVDSRSVLVTVKVKVMWCHLVNANKTPDRGLQGRDNRARSAINLRPEDEYLQLVNIILNVIQHSMPLMGLELIPVFKQSARE